MQSLKIILKDETNFKLTLKTMNAHVKLKMTLNIEFGYLGQEFLFSPKA